MKATNWAKRHFSEHQKNKTPAYNIGFAKKLPMNRNLSQRACPRHLLRFYFSRFANFYRITFDFFGDFLLQLLGIFFHRNNQTDFTRIGQPDANGPNAFNFQPMFFILPL